MSSTRSNHVLKERVSEPHVLRDAAPAAGECFNAETPSGRVTLSGLGDVIAFDLLVNQWDRLPIVWENEGNPTNVMLSRHAYVSMRCVVRRHWVVDLTGAACSPSVITPPPARLRSADRRFTSISSPPLSLPPVSFLLRLADPSGMVGRLSCWTRPSPQETPPSFRKESRSTWKPLASSFMRSLQGQQQPAHWPTRERSFSTSLDTTLAR